ncbi:hypothetical protein Cgig2_010807 [Carnegiea gigantea]|uniref:Smr domain-containing protein n=1 Tax=Carnegiea gigantea TaxID=171969 RepID=A0A9Q1Q4V5_9CARY|nr:hypothetical protein Cgig2_010807 [Carnegiea gigantea]
MKIEGEARDLDWREKALITKETQQVEKELQIVKSQINTVVQDFEEQLRTTAVDQCSSLIRKAESAIASILKSHCPMTDVFSDDMGDLHTPRPGEQVQVKRLAGKVATVVEVSEDGTVLVQYGKVRFRVDRRGVQALEETTAASPSSPLKKQARIPRNLDSLGKRKDEELSYGPMIQTSKNTVDLRGMRLEEASHALDMAIAAREPYSLLFIIHGMGTGVLKEHVVEVLENHPRVVKFEQESPMNYGCTVAFIK